MQNLSPASITESIITYQQQLSGYLDSQLPTADLTDLTGSRDIILLAETFLSSLPYAQIFEHRAIYEIPSSLRHQFTMRVSMSENTADKLLDWQVPLHDIVGKALALSFRPASAIDQQLFNDWLLLQQQDAAGLPDFISAGLFDVGAGIDGRWQGGCQLLSNALW